jgi:hypothetical protein
MELHCAFLKNNRIENIAVFASQDDELANRICEEQGHDSILWFNKEEVPAKWSTYNGTSFVPPTLDYLYEIGMSVENQAMRDAKIAAALETTNDPNSVV